VNAPARAAARNGSHGARGLQQRLLGDVVGVGKRGLIADHGTHAHALVDAEAARLHDALFERIGFAARVLEIKVGELGAMLEHRRQGPLQMRLVQPVRLKQQCAGGGQSFERGVGRFHLPILPESHAFQVVTKCGFSTCAAGPKRFNATRSKGSRKHAMSQRR